MPTVAFSTLGCKVNQYETEALTELFRRRGYEVMDWQEKADIFVINTCAVTAQAVAKSRHQIRHAAKLNPQAKVVVTGCFAQLEAEKIMEIPGVSLVVGTQDRAKIVAMLDEMDFAEPASAVREHIKGLAFEDLSVSEFSGHTRAMLKIQEGCQNFCSYCIIPYARGPERSRPVSSVLAEAARLGQAGYREVVLTGIHLSSYGRDLESKTDLTGLLHELAKVDGIERIRLSSVEPTDIPDQMVDLFARDRKLCPHLHIPLQSGEDEILRRMNRRYRTQEYRQLVARLRQAIPDIAITTDVIVGFPGETEEQFERLYSFVEEMAFSRLHVFRYSARKGTPAAKYADPVPKAVQEERSERLRRLGERMALQYHQRFVGRTLSVLFEQEGEHAGVWSGYTRNYIRVSANLPGDRAEPGAILPVLLTSADAEGAIGQVIESE